MQIVRLENTPNHRDGCWYRITQHGFWTADVRTVAELERFFPIAELREDEGLALAA